jgi:tetratricopeptide (TPR) repeat protein
MSRGLCTLFACLALLAGNASATTTAVSSSDFDGANKLYEQGKFAEAAAAYENLIHSHSGSATLYFNLGNAWFKSGALGRALAAWRQAGHIAPRDPDVRANLQFARTQVQGPTLTPGRWQRWLGRFTLNEWAVLAAVALWVWLLILLAIQFRPNWRPALRTPAWLSGAVFASLALGLGASMSIASAPVAIVVVREASVRNGPLEESQSAFTVHDGAELRVLDQKDDWFQVSLGERRVGWLKREQVIAFPLEQAGNTTEHTPVTGKL